MHVHTPCPRYIMGLLMAGIIIGPVYASLKIWFRTPTLRGIYVTEGNRRGFGSQAVSMTVQSQCDREGG